MKAFFITIFFFGSERKKSINRRPINRPHRQELHTINEKKTGARIQKWKKFHSPKKKEIVFLVVVVVVVQIWKAPPPKKKRHASPRNETQIQKKNRRKKLNFSKKRKRKSATTFSPIDAEPIRFRDKKKWKPHKQKKKNGIRFFGLLLPFTVVFISRTPNQSQWPGNATRGLASFYRVFLPSFHFVSTADVEKRKRWTVFPFYCGHQRACFVPSKIF